jgi:hypothetical protein
MPSLPLPDKVERVLRDLSANFRQVKRDLKVDSAIALSRDDNTAHKPPKAARIGDISSIMPSLAHVTAIPHRVLAKK